MPKVKLSGGRRFSKTCLVRGREAEGRKAILQSKRVHTRIAPIGPDGFALDGSEKIPTADLVDVQPVEESQTPDEGPIPGVVGERGTITIPSQVRRALRIRPGSPVLIEVQGDEIRIRPAMIVPRTAAPAESLDDLVARITPENLHEEISTGPAVGREVF